MATLQTPPGEDNSPPPAEQDQPVTRIRRGGRYVDLQQHELITLLDEVDDERSKARFREAVYISVIVWLILGWVLVYGPRYLWHPPVIVQAPDEPRKTMTYLDTPSDLKKLLRKTPAPAISERNSESQSPKPSPQQPTPRPGTPQPPQQRAQPQQQAPQPQQPQPQPQPQQQARNTPPTPQPTPSRPQPPVDAPAPQPSSKNIFGGQQSAGQAVQQAARGSRGETGDYGSTGTGQQGGTKQGVQILSDTQGVDFSKYLARLLADVRRNWLPLIPEECRPPLNKQGITGIRFTILPDGKIAPGSMHLDYSTHDDAINRAGWGSITALGQAQPLPPQFHGPNLELRIEFRINKDMVDAQ